MIEVHFRKWYVQPTAEIVCFDDPHEALAHAFRCMDGGPWYMLRMHETGSDEWLTAAQFDFRLNGGLVPR